ncbi:MAG: hypothetical protein NZ988_05485 [Thaumarchaeota archaeon]|nr:hypothetical protein [Candidatus Calditenuaceae archaeon]MDW8187476.1 hypothetical protein [Nitrososphaerota archaeon]
MGGDGGSCYHEDLEWLGSQRSDEGENRYYRCKRCLGVIVITPKGEKVYYIPARKEG